MKVRYILSTVVLAAAAQIALAQVPYNEAGDYIAGGGQEGNLTYSHNAGGASNATQPSYDDHYHQSRRSYRSVRDADQDRYYQSRHTFRSWRHDGENRYYQGGRSYRPRRQDRGSYNDDTGSSAAGVPACSATITDHCMETYRQDYVGPPR